MEQTKTSDCNTLVVKTNFGSLELIGDFIQARAHAARLGFKKTWEIMLALDEICCNIISHAKPEQKDRKIKITWKQEPDSTTILLADNGPPFNPLEISPEEIEVLEENKRLGGMGPYLIQKMLDVVTYKRNNGVNCLFLRKYRKK